MTGEFKKLLGEYQRNKAPTKEDLEAFAAEMNDVVPLNNDDKVVLESRKPKPLASFTREDEKRVLDEALESDVQEAEYQSGESLSFARSGVQNTVLRKLRRGDYSIQKECDLHGLVLTDAKVRLKEFLLHCQEENLRCVRIIHGKGMRSGHGGPVIKPMVNRVLRKLDSVLAFHSAKREAGGTGAVVVLLRKK